MTTPQASSTGFGRIATDLRVSLTDRCNLRCTYCMPAEGLDWLPDDEVLTDDEVVRLVAIAVTHLGVDEVRFTGGEPLVRRGLVDIVARCAALSPAPELSVTTNALGPGADCAGRWPRPGSTGSTSASTPCGADTFKRAHPARPASTTWSPGSRRPTPPGCARSRSTPCCMRGVNDDQAPELLRWCLERGYELRFIEQMPLDAQHGWRRDEMVTADEILERARAREFDLRRAEEPRGSAPAELFAVDGGPATVGVIASVTRPFCGDCDRVRLTADGQVRNCLFAREESDLATPLRAGATDEELADRWRVAMLGKRPGHGIDDVTFLQPTRPMSAIGG